MITAQEVVNMVDQATEKYLTFLTLNTNKGIEHMDYESVIEKLKAWVSKNYDAEACGYTAARSYGHYDDCFDDGVNAGSAYAAYEVGCILGMELAEPEEPNYE